MTARFSPALFAAALAVALPVRAADDPGAVPQLLPPSDAPTAPGPASGPAASDAPGTGWLVRPILLVGAGGPVGGGLALGADLGLRVARVSARFSWRGEFIDSGDYLNFPSGRIGWIFLERRWLAAHAGAGAGWLTRSFDDPARATASALALVGEVGVLVAPAWWMGPLLALELEALGPVGRRHPPGAALTAPTFSLMVNVNVFALIGMSWLAPYSPSLLP